MKGRRLFRKFLAIGLSTTLCMGVMTGCSDKKEEASAPAESATQGTAVQASEETPETDVTETSAETASAGISDNPMEKITQGYYQYCYNTEPDNSGMEMYNYFHFYEEAPVIGSVFYAGFAMDQIFYVGTYTVTETPYEYSCYPDRAAVLEGSDSGTDTHVTGTAPYTITCYDWEGNEIGMMGFDGDAVYNDCEALSAVSTEDNIFLFDADGGETGYAEYYAGEVGQKYLDFVAEDPTSTLTLYHNGTYMDMVGMMVEGTWTMAEGEDGYEYTLTPDDDSDTGASFMVAAAGDKAVYTPDGGEAVEMTNAVAGPEIVYYFAGQFEMAGMTADLTAYCYGDNTAAVIASMSGMEMPVDTGTWEMTETYNMLFHLEGAGDVESAGNDDGVSLQYINENTEIGPLDVTLQFVSE